MMIAPLFFSLFAGVSAGSPVAWSFGSNSTDDGKVMIILTAQLEDGWHIYATDLPNDEGPLPTEFRFIPSEAWEVTIPLTEPEPVEEYDPNFATIVRHHSGTPRYTMLVERVNGDPFTVQGEVEYMVCNDRTCLPPVVVPFTIEVEPIEPTR
jgi:DsbC/DsbD-like thiol-disulfide interchange protein